MKRSTLRAGGLGLGVLALALLAYLARRPAPPSEPALAAAPAKQETPTPPLLPPAPPGAAAASPRASAPEASPAPEASFPVPTPDQIKPRPEPKPTTPAERREQKRVSLDLIARSIVRLDKERQSAERAGDGETARLDQIRIERLRKRSEALRQELAGPAPATESRPGPSTGAPPGAP